jgi:hypothetical protein
MRFAIRQSWSATRQCFDHGRSFCAQHAFALQHGAQGQSGKSHAQVGQKCSSPERSAKTTTLIHVETFRESHQGRLVADFA